MVLALRIPTANWASPLFGMQLSDDTVAMIVKIAFSALALVIALASGLLLRRLLVRRLAKTILDNWVTQTLGVLVILPPLLIGGVVALATWRNLPTVISDLSRQYNIDFYTFIKQLISTLILIALGIGIARTLKKQVISGLARGLGESRFDINTRTLLGRIVHICILTILGFSLLSVWNIELGIPLAAVSVITVAITVSIQDILKDFVAGFYLLISRPFYIGDQISVTLSSIVYVGKVQNIELRSTRLRLLTGEETSIPNSAIFLNPVVNLNYFNERRAAIEIKLPSADFAQQETAQRILQELKENESIMPKPEPEILFQGYTEGKTTLLVRFWISSEHATAVSDVMYTLHALLPNADLSVREPVANTI